MILDPVDVGILQQRATLVLAPLRPPEGTPSLIRGEDPDHDYVDHVDPDAVYFVEEPWEELDWEASPELVEAAQRSAAEAAAESEP